MNILHTLKQRFATALTPLTEDVEKYLALIRPSDGVHGDYQANCAMSLAKELPTKSNPRDVAQRIIDQLDVADFCESPEIAGPGFINLKIRQDWLTEQLEQARQSDRCNVQPTENPLTYVVDYSAPNVAKPLHIGHIRSTVIGDALQRILKFLGHKVIGDNHLGDWGTQFGMIIYGYRNFVDQEAYQAHAVQELGRLYKLVRQLMDYHSSVKQLPKLEAEAIAKANELDELQKNTPDDPKAAKKHKQEVKKANKSLAEMREALGKKREKVEAVEQSETLLKLANEHPNISSSVLEETAKLHAGDAENLKLWNEFLPACREDIEQNYQRLGISFDETLGESFYHDQLGIVVEDLKNKQIAKESEGAMCIFLEGSDTPFLIQKSDGAFLYATTDLATVKYRIERWKPDAILYVVDDRQSEHFNQLFSSVRLWGYSDVNLVHVNFGKILGDDRKPFATRSGDVVDLADVLSKAIACARTVVDEIDNGKPTGAELSEEERKSIAEVVGIGAVKYADLSQNRTSDYVFSFEKMVALKGNTATYIQYSYARCCSILRKSGEDIDALQQTTRVLQLNEPAEKALALQLLRFGEALELVQVDFRPNMLTSYLFDLAKEFSTFWENCPVLKEDVPDDLRKSRLVLCDLVARTLKQGLELLGIQVVPKM